jgi:hypothetical protein
MASRIVTLPNGTKGAVDPALFAADPGNTLGSLAKPYATFALGFEYTTVLGVSAWRLNKSEVTVGNYGDGDINLPSGFLGTQGQSETSLLKNGFFSSKASFTAKGHSVSPNALVYTPTTVTDGNVSLTGASRNDCQGIRGDLIKGALGSAYWELYQQSRKCFTLLGLSAELPAGFGFAAQDDVTNGTLGFGQSAQYRRPTVIPPGNTNTPEYLWRCTFGSSIAISADPSFAAPIVTDDAAIKANVFFDGYYSDENGIPLVMDGDQADVYESLIANDVKVCY